MFIHKVEQEIPFSPILCPPTDSEEDNRDPSEQYIPSSPPPWPTFSDSELPDPILTPTSAVQNSEKISEIPTQKPRKKRGKRGSKTKENLQSTVKPPIEKDEKKKRNKIKKFKRVPGHSELFFFKKESDFPYKCTTCGVGTKLPSVYNKHLQSEKHVSTLSLTSDPVVCLFCKKDFNKNIHNFKKHFEGASHFKKFKNFQE